MFFLEGIKDFFWKKVIKLKLFLMQKNGNKQVVSEVCEACNTKNYKLIPKNVVAGVFTDCEACGEMMYFPSPQSPFKEDEAKKSFEKLVKENIH